eukprot:14710125-Alexandrium_andersonii.AAC.1
MLSHARLHCQHMFGQLGGNSRYFALVWQPRQKTALSGPRMLLPDKLVLEERWPPAPRPAPRRRPLGRAEDAD